MHMMDTLARAAREKGPVCVGLDTQPDFLPEVIRFSGMPLQEQIFTFNRAIVDGTRDACACYKLQIACYEAMGLAGMNAFARTLAYVRAGGSVAITDGKRGDISSTAAQYARAHFSGDFESDLLTVNPYMGEDAISPYYGDIARGKGLFVLVKTSNPGSGEFEDQMVDGEPLFVRVAERVEAWGSAMIGECGYSAIGAVAGCTYPEQMASIRAHAPHAFLLIPGYGAQGGTGRDMARVFSDGICGVVNSSRGILCAHRGHTEGADFAAYARRATLAMREDILKWL